MYTEADTATDLKERTARWSLERAFDHFNANAGVKMDCIEVLFLEAGGHPYCICCSMQRPI
jgi:hypothetical protein